MKAQTMRHAPRPVFASSRRGTGFAGPLAAPPARGLVKRAAQGES
jgi:hypothetical protein